MKRYAIIDGGTVENIIVVGDDGWPDGVEISEDSPVGMGWTYDGITFNSPGYPTPEPAPIPTAVTMRQARLALLAAGMLDEVENAIDATGDPAAQIEWDYAATVERASPFTQQLAGALGLDDAALDELFTQAAAL